VYGSPRAWRRPVRCHRRCRHRAAADRQTLGPGGGRRGDWRSALPHDDIDGAASWRREQFHEALEVVDAAPAGAGIPPVFRLGNRIADPHAIRWDADGPPHPSLARSGVGEDRGAAAQPVAVLCLGSGGGKADTRGRRRDLRSTFAPA
jgi:hypothetical protein